MIDILNKCQEIIEQEEDCEDIEEVENCFTCLQSNFYSRESDTYNCLKKLCHYAINYGPIYVSEIYHFLSQSKLLEKYFSKIDRPLNILSLGAGIGPDYMALTKYIDDNHLSITFSYTGYDKEPLWKNITEDIFDNIPVYKDVIDGFNCTNIDIIFINKLFSTLHNHGLHQDFLKTLQDEIQNLPIGSFVIFNDINNHKMGRDIFNQFVLEQNCSLKNIGKYFFNVDGAYSNSYTAIKNVNNICKFPNDFKYSPKLSAMKTVFFVYQKIEEEL